MKPKKPSKKKEPTDFDPKDFIASAQITSQDVQREVRVFEMRQAFDEYGSHGKPSRFGLDVSTFMDHATQQMILTLKAKIASKKFDVKTVRFPDGPWQFLKFNLANSQARGIRAVQWFLKRHPVRFVEVTMEANAYHPDIAIPDHDTYVNIYVSARRAGH